MAILFGFSSACASSPPALAQAAPAKAQLVLFGAHWCIPCRAEAARLPALVAAAAPARVVVAWIDSPLALPAGLPAGQVAALPPAAARALAETIAGPGYGLPLAASMTSAGQLCAARPRPLRPEDIAPLLAACGQ